MGNIVIKIYADNAYLLDSRVLAQARSRGRTGVDIYTTVWVGNSGTRAATRS